MLDLICLLLYDLPQIKEGKTFKGCALVIVLISVNLTFLSLDKHKTLQLISTVEPNTALDKRTAASHKKPPDRR